jgi:hypothetical protein
MVQPKIWCPRACRDAGARVLSRAQSDAGRPARPAKRGRVCIVNGWTDLVLARAGPHGAPRLGPSRVRRSGGCQSARAAAAGILCLDAVEAGRPGSDGATERLCPLSSWRVPSTWPRTQADGPGALRAAGPVAAGWPVAVGGSRWWAALRVLVGDRVVAGVWLPLAGYCAVARAASLSGSCSLASALRSCSLRSARGARAGLDQPLLR